MNRALLGARTMVASAMPAENRAPRNDRLSGSQLVYSDAALATAASPLCRALPHCATSKRRRGLCQTLAADDAHASCADQPRPTLRPNEASEIHAWDERSELVPSASEAGPGH